MPLRIRGSKEVAGDFIHHAMDFRFYSGYK